MHQIGEILFIEKAGSGFRKIEGYSGTVMSPGEVLQLEKAGTFIEGLDSNEEGVFFIEINGFIYKDDEGENSELDSEEREVEYDCDSIWAVRDDKGTKFVPLVQAQKLKHFWEATDNQGHSMCCSFCGIHVDINESEHWEQHVEADCTKRNEISIEELKDIVHESLLEVVLVSSNQAYSKGIYFSDSEVEGWLIFKQEKEELLYHVYQRSSDMKVDGSHIYLQEPLTGKELERQLLFLSEERSYADV